MKNYQEWFNTGWLVMPFGYRPGKDGDVVVYGLPRWTEHERSEPTRLAAEFKKIYGKEPVVWGLVGGRELSNQPGKFALAIDADAPDAFEALKARLPATRTQKGSKLGHFVFITDEPCEPFTYDLPADKDGKRARAVDVQGIGRMIILPPSPHRKTGKAYEIVDDVTPAFVTLKDILTVLESVAHKQGWQKAEDRVSKAVTVEIKTDAERDAIKQNITLFSLGLVAGKQKCPFPGHTTPEGHFYVRPDGKGYTCFGRHGSGDVFSFIQEHDGCDFMTAKNKLLAMLPGREQKPPLPQEVERSDTQVEKTQAEVNDGLALSHAHLPGADSLAQVIGLLGPEYANVVKGVWYSSVGALNPYCFSVGSIECDTRIPLLVVIESGGGKQEIQNAFRFPLERLHLKVFPLSSYHPEQFIGKMIQRKFKLETSGEGKTGEEKKKETVEKWISNPGHLSNDVILGDEAIMLLTSKDDKHAESRKYLRMALNPIGQNEIKKRQIDNLNVDSEILKYMPKVTPVFFLPPKPMPEDFALDGDLRRFAVLYVRRRELRDRREDYHKRLVQVKNQGDLEKWVSVLKESASHSYTNFEPEAMIRLENLHLELLSLGAVWGAKARNFTRIADHVLLNNLVRYAVVLARGRGERVVSLETVELAYVDMFEMWVNALRYIEEVVEGALDYGAKYRSAEGRERLVLDYLWAHDAYGPEVSSVSIAMVYEFLQEKEKVGVRTAIRVLESLREKNLVKSQKGQHDSKVWATYTPKQARCCERFVFAESQYKKIVLARVMAGSADTSRTPALSVVSAMTPALYEKNNSAQRALVEQTPIQGPPMPERARCPRCHTELALSSNNKICESCGAPLNEVKA